MRGSLSDFARHIGASPAYVTKLKSQGRLVFVDGDGGKQLVDFEQSARAIRNTTDMAKASNGKNAGGEGSKPAGDVAGAGRFDAVFRQAQAKERVFESKMSELEYRKMAGELIELTAVEKLWSQRMSQTREVLDGLRSRLAPRLAAESDLRKIDEMLQAEHDAALRAMAGQTAPIAQPEAMPT